MSPNATRILCGGCYKFNMKIYSIAICCTNSKLFHFEVNRGVYSPSQSLIYCDNSKNEDESPVQCEPPITMYALSIYPGFDMGLFAKKVSRFQECKLLSDVSERAPWAPWAQTQRNHDRGLLFLPPSETSPSLFHG